MVSGGLARPGKSGLGSLEVVNEKLDKELKRERKDLIDIK